MEGSNGFYAKYIKRGLDILCSSLALLVLGLPMAVFAVCIRVNMGKPVLFTQDRIGKNEKKFKLLKFRSMKNAYDEFGVPLPDRERITSLGMFIRKTSIDELPSLINIFIGDMSVIGPRPLPWNYKPWFKQEERIRHTVRGGLSGLAQVNGRNNLTWEEKFNYDKQYIENISFSNDVILVWKTIMKVLKRADVGERGRNKNQGDFHSYRSGLSEKDLIKMEKYGYMPSTYEEWWALTDEERKSRYEREL